jgi:hypothetical protein
VNVAAGAIYEAVVDFGRVGLVGTIGLSVLDNEGNTTVARETTNIIEISPGVYSRVGNIAPADPGQYSLRWDDGSLAVGHTALEDLLVTAHTVGPLPVSVSASSEICALWASVDEMTDCCSDLATTDETQLEWALQQASEILYKLSGHRYAGECTATVRPCSSYLSCWDPVLLSGWRASDCACVRLSKVRLAGYPVQSITSVMIDGDIIDPSEYRLDRGRELVRLADANGLAQSWPTCQRLDLESGEGTFIVTYTYGQSPPLSGVQAAAQLACEIAKQCPGVSGAAAEDCALPTGTVRIARQGITIDTQALGVWLIGTQQTGLALVDAFLSVYGAGRRRRTALLVPEADPWPLRTG